MPTVDVLIPAYNTGRFLAAALDSVEAQTFKDWRIILINDGSTDDTEQITAPYRERLGEKFLYIHQQNAGVSAARNEGVRRSDSPFIALLDGDDIWLPNRLEASLQSFERNTEAGLSYGLVSRIDADGAIVATLDEVRPDAEGWVARSIYTRRFHIINSTVMLRRSCVEQVGMFDENMTASEDRDLWLRIAQKFPVVRVSKVIAHYRISPGAATSSVERMFSAQKFFVEKHRGTPHCDEDAYKQSLSGVYRQRAETLGLRGQMGAAFRSAICSLQLAPTNRENLRTAAWILWHSVPGNHIKL